MEVIIEGGDFEVGLKVFTKQVSKDGILKEWKVKSAFESNRERRRRKEHMAALRREKKGEHQSPRFGL